MTREEKKSDRGSAQIYSDVLIRFDYMVPGTIKIAIAIRMLEYSNSK